MSEVKYLIEIEYNGKNYAGYQRQKNAKTIQGELEKAMKLIFCKDINTVASGRTDAGVNAINQAVHFCVDSHIKMSKIPFALNSKLPSDIKVKTIKQVDRNFNARKCAKKKTYQYRFYISDVERPLFEENCLKLSQKIDIKAMRKALKYVVGTHDFRCFMASGSQIENTVRTIYGAKLIYEKKENTLTMELTGNGFLYNMVRIIAGTLLDFAYRKHSPKYMKQIILSQNRGLAGATAKSRALFLKKVYYKD